MEVHTYNPSAQEVKAGKSQLQDKHELWSEALSQDCKQI
jgi:hypothetical protein